VRNFRKTSKNKTREEIIKRIWSDEDSYESQERGNSNTPKDWLLITNLQKVHIRYYPTNALSVW